MIEKLGQDVDRDPGVSVALGQRYLYRKSQSAW